MKAVMGKHGRRSRFIPLLLSIVTLLSGQQRADSLLYVLPQGPVAEAGEASLLRLIIISATLIVVLVLTLFFLRRRNPQFANTGALVFRMKKYIGPKQYLTIVSIGDQHLLLGVTDQNITFLTAIEDISGWEEIKTATPALSFASLLNRVKTG